MTPSHPRAGEERRWKIKRLHSPNPDPRHSEQRANPTRLEQAVAGPETDWIEVMPVPSDHQPARLGPEPKVEANKQEQPSEPLLVALEREELEALLGQLDNGKLAVSSWDSFYEGRSKLRTALSEPRGGA